MKVGAGGTASIGKSKAVVAPYAFGKRRNMLASGFRCARSDPSRGDRHGHQGESDAGLADTLGRQQQQSTQLQHHHAGHQLEQAAFALAELARAMAS
ncbi:MAG: hypothetical protein WC540_13095 [Sulfuritalea sp.]